MLKTNQWTCKVKDVNGEKIIQCVYEKELLLSYYPESDIHIRHNIKLVLNLTNYATKRNCNMQHVLLHLI